MDLDQSDSANWMVEQLCLLGVVMTEQSVLAIAIILLIFFFGFALMLSNAGDQIEESSIPEDRWANTPMAAETDPDALTDIRSSGSSSSKRRKSQSSQPKENQDTAYADIVNSQVYFNTEYSESEATQSSVINHDYGSTFSDYGSSGDPGSTHDCGGTFSDYGSGGDFGTFG